MTKLRVGFVVDGKLPAWPYAWQFVRGCPSHSAVGEMRFGWIAGQLNATARDVHYTLYRSWQRYDAIVFLKSMNAASQRLAALERARGTRIIFDLNVDYFTPPTGTLYYRGMAPSAQQVEDAHRMAALSDALIADSSHLASIGERHHPRVRWIPDNVDLRLAPPCGRWTPSGKLDLLWSGEAVKLFELLSIEDVLRRFASRVRLKLITNDLAALDRWVEPYKSRFQSLLAAIDHTILPFRNIPDLLRIYAQGGVFISPRFLDNSYNWGHTEWKIALPMACGRLAFGSPLPSYRDVALRSGDAGLRICSDDEAWTMALDDALSGRIDFVAEENAARAVIEQFYSTPVVAAAHHGYLTEVCVAGN